MVKRDKCTCDTHLWATVTSEGRGRRKGGKSEEESLAKKIPPRICIQLIQIYNRLYIRVAGILLSGGCARLVQPIRASVRRTTRKLEKLTSVVARCRCSHRSKAWREFEPEGATVMAEPGTSSLVWCLIAGTIRDRAG